MGLEPIPETVDVMGELASWDEGGDLLGGLMRLVGRAEAVVPDLVGVSITRLDHGLTFTVAASDERLAVLDAAQYLDGGPCVQGAFDQRVHQFRPGAPETGDIGDVLDEDRWRLFSAATAARGVRSTLTLPLAVDGSGLGSVNLYAGSGDAFVGHHEELALIFGTWAEGAVSNADLEFLTRRTAQAAPQVMQDMLVVASAGGLLAAQLDIEVEEAEERLTDAAALVGMSPTQLAHFLVDTLDTLDPGDG